MLDGRPGAARACEFSSAPGEAGGISAAPALRWKGSWRGWPTAVRLLVWATRNNHPTRPHRVARMGWLRAALLGANDGLVSVASIIVGVAAASDSARQILLSGVAGLVAGAMSMAAGEFVSVSSQADIEKAELARIAAQLRTAPELELNRLADIYAKRGVESSLAMEVAAEITRHDALRAHARDELGLSKILSAKPLQAACASAVSFTLGAAAPLTVAGLAGPHALIAKVIAATLLCLALLGAIGAWLGGAPVVRAVARVACWGALALAGTMAAGSLFGAVAP